jgi:Family of unknown function (DUF6152)
MKAINVSLVISALGAFAAPAIAHHSAAVLYDLAKEVEVEGVVTRFTLGNPHARIYMLVKDENGDEAEWMAEGGSRTVLSRNGWTGDEVKPGDVVTVVGNPSRDGSKSMHWKRLLLPDGRSLWGEDIPEDSVLEELRQRRR